MQFVPRNQICGKIKKDMIFNKTYSKISYFLKKIISLTSPNILERQNIYEFHKSKLFYFGLITRLILIIFCTPVIQEIWFVEFIKNSLESLSFNPWEDHLNAGGDVQAFPYGFIMYLVYLPLTAIGWVLDKLFSFHYFSLFGFTITSLILDYGILHSISRLLKNYSPKLLLSAYWCSPIILYIFYWHGQIDVLPVFLLLWGLVFLQEEKTILAGAFLGIAISAKFSMIASIPFIFIYLIRNRRLDKFNFLIGSIVFVNFILILIFINSILTNNDFVMKR